MVAQVTVTVSGSTFEIDKSNFDISKFKSTLTNSYHRTNLFHMILNTPSGLIGVNNANFSYAPQKIMFDIEKATMPGVSIVTDDIRRYGFGYFDRKPYATDFAELDVIVRSDGAGFNYNFFQSWMKLIINFDMRTGSIDNTGTGIGSVQQTGRRGSPYEVNYKKDYSITSELIAYSEDAERAIGITMRNFFPIYLGEIQYDWADNNTIVKFPVKFTFSDWYQTDVNVNTTIPSLPPELTPSSF